jgi:hypothetical protein
MHASGPRRVVVERVPSATGMIMVKRMTSFTSDRSEAQRIEREVRDELNDAMWTAARLSEFTVDMPLHLDARRPLSPVQREVAVALNTLARLLDQRADDACRARDPRWEGLADASTMLLNAAGYRELPQLLRP